MRNASDSMVHAHLSAVRRRWPAGLLMVAAVLAVLVPVAIGLPNLYRSSATLMVIQAPEPLNQASSQVLEVSARLQTIRQEALTRQNALALADELNLYPDARQAGMLDAVVGMMQRDFYVEPNRGSRGDGRVTTVSFRVSYTGDDPIKVANAANRLATYYVQRSGTMRTEQASRAADALRTELDEAQRRLEAQQQRVLNFTRQNAGALPQGLTNITTRQSQLMTQFNTTTSEISHLIERRDNLQTQISGLLTPTTTTTNTGDPTVQLEQARRELQNLIGRYTESSFEIRSKRAEVANLERLVAARGAAGTPGSESSQLSTLRGQLEDLNRRIADRQQAAAAMQEELSKYDRLIEQAPASSTELEGLMSAAAQMRTAYNNLSARYQDALAGGRAQTGVAGQEFEVLDPAVPAEAPSAPDRRLLLAFAGVAALALGIGLILLLERLDRSFKSVDELRAFTHVPVLGTIPRIATRQARVRRAVVGVVTAAAVSVVLGAVSFGVLHVARQAEPITRMLIR